MPNNFGNKNPIPNNAQASSSTSHRAHGTKKQGSQTKPFLKTFEVPAVNLNQTELPLSKVNKQIFPDQELEILRNDLSELRNLLENNKSSNGNVPTLIHKMTQFSTNNSPGHPNIAKRNIPPNAFSYLSVKPQTQKKPIKYNPIYKLNKIMTKCYNCRKGAGIIHLNCHHVFCAICLITPVSNEENPKCPFQNGNFRCTYKFKFEDKQYIINAIRTSLDQPSTKPKPKNKIVRHQPNSNKIQDTEFFFDADVDSAEVIVHCKEDKCVGYWFIDVTEERNRYQCPVCETYNNYLNEDVPNDQTFSNETTWVSGKESNDTRNSKEAEYYRLLQLEDKDHFIPNFDEFECIICREIILPDNGVLLRTCFHNFCETCIRKYIEEQDEPEIKCPNYECTYILQDREIKSLISQEAYNRHLQISLRVGKSKFENGYNCCVPNCEGWWIFTEGIYNYNCTVCHTINCITCKASHPGVDCKTYQCDLFYSTDKNGIETRHKLELMLKTGEAEHCPKCNIIVVKNGGCPQMRCSMCRTDFVWGQRRTRNLNII